MSPISIESDMNEPTPRSSIPESFERSARSANGEPETLSHLPALDAGIVPTAPRSEPVDVRAPAGYVIEKELGRGGMGVVYLARDLALDRPCALKVILHGPHTGDDEAARFRTE